MNDDAFDALLRQGLLGAAEEDAQALPEADAAFSSAYCRRRMRLLANPFGIAKRSLRPMWKKLLQTAACLLLVSALGFASVMVVSPSARAWVVRWVREWYETQIVYRFSGEQEMKEMPSFALGELPEGYVEITRNTAPGYVEVIYESVAGERICFNYTQMQQGSVSALDSSNATVTNIHVNNLPGQFFESNNPRISNAVIWIDEKKNLWFSLDMNGSKSDILHIAESAILEE